MSDEEINTLLQKHAHLKKYINSITKKMERPVFYAVLPMTVKGEEYPNLIYAAKGTVFIHIFKTKDMDEIEYQAIEPELDDDEQIKHDRLLKLLVKKAPEKRSILTDEELREILKELIDEIIIIDENAVKAPKEKKGKKRKKMKK